MKYIVQVYEVYAGIFLYLLRHKDKFTLPLVIYRYVKYFVLKKCCFILRYGNSRRSFILLSVGFRENASNRKGFNNRGILCCNNDSDDDIVFSQCTCLAISPYDRRRGARLGKGKNS